MKSKIRLKTLKYSGQAFYTIDVSKFYKGKGYTEVLASYLNITIKQTEDMMKRYGARKMNKDMVFYNRFYTYKAIEWAKSIEFMKELL